MLGDEIDFDIERLAKEVDGVFQEKFKKGEQVIEQNIQDFDKLCKKNLEVYRKDVGEVITTNIDVVLQELQKGRSVIHIDNGPPITINQMDHPQTEDVIKSLVAHKKILLVGPAG